MVGRFVLVFALALFQTLATCITLRRFCPRRILATHESAVYQQTPSISVSSQIPQPRIRIWIGKKPSLKSLHEILCQRGTAQVNTPNDTVINLCKLKSPFFAKDTVQVNTPNAPGILAIWILSYPIKSAVSEVVVRTSTSRPFRPLGHIYQATTLWPVVNIQPLYRTPYSIKVCNA